MSSPNPIKAWIDRIAPSQSLIDIGGIGENSTNERVSEAAAAGATQVAMADIEPFTSPYWSTFRQKMANLGVTGYEEYERVDIRDAELIRRLPTFEIVHCTGIVYHLPDPSTGVYNLSRLARRWLIINTIVLPERIENDQGSLLTEGSRVLFLPALSEGERAVLRTHYELKFGWSIDVTAPRLDDPNPMMPYVADTGLSCWPYWWLFSHDAFRCLVRMMGFRIHDQWLWEDHTLALLCERTTPIAPSDGPPPLT
jgi:hypothetical protein